MFMSATTTAETCLALLVQELPIQVKVTKTFEFLKGPVGAVLSFVWKVLCCLLPLVSALLQPGASRLPITYFLMLMAA